MVEERRTEEVCELEFLVLHGAVEPPYSHVQLRGRGSQM